MGNPRQTNRFFRAAFTMTELMVSVAILVVIIVATSRIFATVSRISAVGNAANDILQEAAAIERQFRDDIANLAADGVFAIRCVAVPNDVNDPGGTALLNPLLLPDAHIRADQLVFFTNGLETSKTFAIGASTRSKGQATAARMYYGHAYQLPSGYPYDTSTRFSYDADPSITMTPWNFDNVDQVSTNYTGFSDNGFCPDMGQANAGTIDGTQPEARQWLFIRQPVLLVDDDDGGCPFLWLGLAPNSENGPGSGNNPVGQQVTMLSAPSFYRSDPFVRDGRIDASDVQMPDLRQDLVEENNGTIRTWDRQQAVIRNELLYYPRAERHPRSLHRVDQSLTNNVLASACSSFIVEWTYDEGVGANRDADGDLIVGSSLPTGPDLENGTWDDNLRPGLQVDPLSPDGLGRSNKEHPWFGMPDATAFRDSGAVVTDRTRGVGAMGRPLSEFDYLDAAAFSPPFTITPVVVTAMPGVTRLNNIETVYTTGQADETVVYEALFGYNHDRLLDGNGNHNHLLAYTPRPNALRVTMTLHDSRTKLEAGRTFQFVVRLPDLD